MAWRGHEMGLRGAMDDDVVAGGQGVDLVRPGSDRRLRLGWQGSGDGEGEYGGEQGREGAQGPAPWVGGLLCGVPSPCWPPGRVSTHTSDECRSPVHVLPPPTLSLSDRSDVGLGLTPTSTV